VWRSWQKQKHLLTSILNKNDQQEIALLKHLAKEEKLILMLEGLDEVNDCKEQVIHLIDALDKDETYKLNKFIITTRNHLKQELEEIKSAGMKIVAED
jgi:tRNA A37 threonylcarbamoyladenosine synthetase subunit TsaC/SUA5/YrdC